MKAESVSLWRTALLISALSVLVGCNRLRSNGAAPSPGGCANSDHRIKLEALWVTDERTELADLGTTDGYSLAVVGQDLWPWERYDSWDPALCGKAHGCVNPPKWPQSWPQAFHVGRLDARGRVIWSRVAEGGLHWDELRIADSVKMQFVAARDNRKEAARILVRGYENHSGSELWTSSLDSTVPPKFEVDLPQLQSLSSTPDGLLAMVGKLGGEARLSGANSRTIDVVAPERDIAPFLAIFGTDGSPEFVQIFPGRSDLLVAPHKDGRLTVVSSTVGGQCTRSGVCLYLEDYRAGTGLAPLRTIPGVAAAVATAAPDGGIFIVAIPAEPNPLSSVTEQHVVVRLDPRGNPLWNVPLPGALVHTIAVSGDAVTVGGCILPPGPGTLVTNASGFAAAFMAAIWILDGNTGHLRAKYAMGDGSVAKIVSGGPEAVWMKIMAGSGGLDLGPNLLVRHLRDSGAQVALPTTWIARVRLPL